MLLSYLTSTEEAVINCSLRNNSLSADDMEIAPDFFDYFEAAATLLEKDPYVLCFHSCSMK